MHVILLEIRNFLCAIDPLTGFYWTGAFMLVELIPQTYNI